MKKILILIAVFAVTNILNAQINELIGLNPNQVIGVFKDQNKAFTLSFLETRNSDNVSVYQVSYLETDYKRLAIEVPSNYIFRGSAEAENDNYLIFWNREAKTLKLFSVNNSKIKSSTISLDSNPNLTQYYYQAYVMDDNNLALTFKYTINNDDKTRELGYDLLIVNHSDLKEIAKYREVIGELNINVIDVLSTSTGYVFMRELSNFKNKKFDIDLLFLDKNLKVLNSKLLTEEKNKFIPSKLALINDKVIVIGNYMFSSFFKSWNSEGLFVKTFDTNGDNATSKEYPWLDLKENLKESKKGRGDFVFDGKNRIVIEDIVPVGNGFQVICESYAMSTGFTPSEFLLNDRTRERVITVYDFVLFNFSETNELVAIDIFQKDKMNIDLTGYGGKNYSNFLIAEQLRKARILPYQYFSNNEIHFVTYVNGVGYFSKLDLSTNEIEDIRDFALNPEIEVETNAANKEFIDNNGFLSSLNKLSEGINKIDEKLNQIGNQMDYAMNKVDLRFNGMRVSSSGYVLLNNNKKMLFLMDDSRLSVFYELVD